MSIPPNFPWSNRDGRIWLLETPPLHALQNGAGLGMVMEIEGIFQRAKNAFGEVLIVMTGGDAVFLADRLESQIFVAPELVTQGLFQILAFNVKTTY